MTMMMDNSVGSSFNQAMGGTKGLSYVFPIDLQRLSHCPLSQFWRALVAAGSIWAWS
jgi:hypothetical protein